LGKIEEFGTSIENRHEIRVKGMEKINRMTVKG